MFEKSIVKTLCFQQKENEEYLSMAIKDDLLEVLKVGIVDEGA